MTELSPNVCTRLPSKNCNVHLILDYCSQITGVEGPTSGTAAAHPPGNFPADAFNVFSVTASGHAPDGPRASPDKVGAPLGNGVTGSAYFGFAKARDL